MKGDVAGVRIIPPVIEFQDTEQNVIYKIDITVKNISKFSKSIRYYGPQTKEFALKVKNPDKPVAPGLEVPALVEYCYSGKGEHNDKIVLTVDDEVIEVPINAVPCRPILSLDGPVDFGHVVANSKVISREVMLRNTGSKAGDFKIKYAGDKPISVIPGSGSIPAKSILPIKVEYVTKRPGQFDEYAKVKLEGQEPSYLQILGSVVEGSLFLLSPDLEDIIECVDFGCTYYGTDKTESAILYNNSPEPVNFVAILDENAIGQELGVDLTKSTSAALMERSMSHIPQRLGGEMNDLITLVTAIPNQGVLGPYEKTPIFFHFSPRWNEASQGFHCKKSAAPRKDFALFIHIELVGASAGFQDSDSDSSNVKIGGHTLEIALTATALPVLLTLKPQNKFDFGECPVGEHVEALCTLTNDSTLLPVTYQFRRIAHFTVKPPKSKILPGHSQDVIFTFAPNQAGTFKPTQYVDIIGPVADSRNPFLMYQEIIQSIAIAFTGKSDLSVAKKKPMFNPGITPKITNEVGLYTDVAWESAKKSPRAALLQAAGSKLHKHKTVKDRKGEHIALVAFPNDRAGSIRPSDRNERYRTIFTHAERHTFVDPDYAYTDEEALAIQAHKQYYSDFITYLRETRKSKDRAKEFGETNNNIDIGIKPAAGLKPKKILAEEVGSDRKVPQPPNDRFRLVNKSELAAIESASSEKVCDGLNAEPTTAQEKADCKKILSPQELYQVIIGPPTIDFKEVCLRSTNQKEVSIVNNLDKFIHVVIHVDCKELRQTSPLSQVVPPRSKAIVPVIFESSTRGKFQRSVDYVVNGFYKNHLTVFAEVVPVALELSAEQITLEPTIGLPAEAGIRGVITVRNKLNQAGEFTWAPILSDRGTAFSIRPASGVVDAYSELDCEVVFHPSFMAPEDGMFALQVHGDNSLKLKCGVKIGEPNVQFIDRRVMFGQVPLHLTTTRIAMIRNNGQHHAFFQVLDPNPFPGLQVSPLHGIVPVGGMAELAITLTSSAIMKFDTRVQVAIRNGKTLELRMGGAVEPPCVDIDLSSFNFGGVYCGSSAVSQFKLKNMTNTKTRMEFDLSRYSDFSLKFPGVETSEDFTFQLMNPGVYSVTMEPNEIIDGEMHFHPTEVASYDFVVPVTVNQRRAPTPEASPMPPTPAPSQKNSLNHIVNPRPIHVAIATPSRKVVATALRQPLQLSHLKLDFSVSLPQHELSLSAGVPHHKVTVLVNNSDKPLQWSLDLSDKDNTALTDGVFRFQHASGTPFPGSEENGGVSGTLEPGQAMNLGITFCPLKPGYYEASIPVIINKDKQRPFTHITITGILKAPRISFDPLAIVLTPAPLDTNVIVEFRVLAINYTKKCGLKAEVPEVEGEDGSMLIPLKINFLDQPEIQGNSGDDTEPCSIRCSLTFASSRPVSFSQGVKFIDEMNNVFVLPVTATADNSLLTCYPFLAQHRTDHQIVCEQGASLKGRHTASSESLSVGEAILVPCGESQRPSSRPSTTATSSNFEVSTSSYESSSQSATDSTLLETPRDGALNKFTTESEMQSRGTKQNQDLASRSLGSAVFPEEDTEEGIFHTEVLLAVQRWFSAQGWPGPHPIYIPHSLRTGLSKKPNEEKAINSKGGTWEANNLKKEFKTVYDMIAHLCGKPIPGIPLNNPLPNDPYERAKQVYWQHSTLLTFLKTQGACVASIKPEYLMEPRDYKIWVALQKEIELRKARKSNGNMDLKTEEEEALEEQLFEAVSKRAWTDILLQLLKVLVLSRVSPRKFRSLPHPYRAELPMVDPNPLCSNVYSVSERILLLWLNHNYEQQRYRIWKKASKGGVPPSRWIVNFDFDLLDGLVLAAVIAAHAPFLIESHFVNMYTQPATAEQCLHNALKVVTALHHINIEYDIQAIDITDPNPISLLLLCLHLYNTLPQYLPRASIEFIGGMHQTVLRQVKLSNPSTKPLTYHAMIAGRDAQDFLLPRGCNIELGPKTTSNVSLEFVSRFLRPAEAVLVLVGRRQGSSTGTSLVFSLHTLIDNIYPKGTIKCKAPCYEVQNVLVMVTNPYPKAAEFHIILVENQADIVGDGTGLLPSAPGKTNNSLGKKPTSKRVLSKVNHSKRTSPDLSMEEDEVRAKISKAAQEKGMQAFSCSTKTIHLEAHGPGSVEVQFLPFQTGKHQCFVVFANADVGEFIYGIDATATLPQPVNTPFVQSSSNMRITSAAAAGCGGGLSGGREDAVYWRCEVGQTLKEKISVPVLNEAAEQALLIAAQQNMTELELKRRRVTGTLDCATVTTRAVDRLTSSAGPHPPARPRPRETTFMVEVDSPYFTAPKLLSIPMAVHRSASTANRPSSTNSINLGVPEGAMVDLPMTFTAKQAGNYKCNVVLTAPDDVRVYRIECIVVPQGSDTELEFTSPVHQAITQDIPVVNQTASHWQLEAHVEGLGFVGPATLLAKAYSTSHYPLIFRPQREGPVQGHLVLRNPEDGVEQRFTLQGTGEKPLPLKQLIFHAQVKQNIQKTLQIPNITQRKIHYKVVSDLDFVSGPEYVTVLPGKSVTYPLTINPMRRGHYKGILSFVAGEPPTKELDSDGEEVAETEDAEMHGYTVWYSLQIHVTPAAPQKTISIKCPCQKQVVAEVGFTNPSAEELTFEVEIQPNNVGVRGERQFKLTPSESGVYQLHYAPAIIGSATASVIFYHERVGEFWYNLELVGEAPAPTYLPHMRCELGRWVRQFITLNNPTDETLHLIPTITNTNNFVLERDNQRPLELQAYSSLKLPLTFMPSNLGAADHRATISFHCEQLGEWVYYASGSGCLPQPQDPVSITAVAGASSTLLIPFRNPLDETVFAQVQLIDKDVMTEKVLDNTAPPGENKPSASRFSLLLKNTNNIRLGPKNNLDIPISFAPEEMHMFEALVTVTLRRAGGGNWSYDLSDETEHIPQGSERVELTELKWQFPVRGYPELTSQDKQPAVVTCQARERLEERLEVMLTGVAPAVGGPKRGIKARAKSATPAEDDAPPEGVVIGETLALAEEFTFELVYKDDDSKKTMEASVVLSLVRQERDKHTGLVLLVFNVIYAPYKPMSHEVQLIVRGATGGMWKFPLLFQATEPEPDDCITIEAAGLNKTSSVGFRLNSQISHPAPYNAYFVAGSDPEFSVFPASGELLPAGTNGTLIEVTFTPRKYGKHFQGRLVIQTSDMQWTYNIRGVLPDYNPPRGFSTHPMAGPHPDPRQHTDHINYIKDNMTLTTTAVSSPIKGAPVIPRLKTAYITR